MTEKELLIHTLRTQGYDEPTARALADRQKPRRRKRRALTPEKEVKARELLADGCAPATVAAALDLTVLGTARLLAGGTYAPTPRPPKPRRPPKPTKPSKTPKPPRPPKPPRAMKPTPRQVGTVRAHPLTDVQLAQAERRLCAGDSPYLVAAAFNLTVAEAKRIASGKPYAAPVRVRKLGPDDAAGIRRALARGETQRAVAARYGVTQPNIHAIANNRTHVQETPDD